MIKIESIEHLLEELQKENNNYFVAVSPLVKSDKTIKLDLKESTISINSKSYNHKEVIPLDELDESVLQYYIDENILFSY